MIYSNSVCVDFTSTGQVKDAQNLVKYGFKFGMRPIYTGKYKIGEPRRNKLVV